MPSMSAIERAFCRSPPWGWAARHVVAPWALSGFEPRGDVLELGAGDGAMAQATALAFPEVDLTVTDVDAAMVEAARVRLAGHSNVTVLQADVTKLAFEDESFDVVCSYLMLHHVVEWKRALREATRVLRPGGTFIGYDIAKTPVGELVHRFDRSPHRLVALGEFAPGMLEVGLHSVSVRPSLARHLVRFAGTK